MGVIYVRPNLINGKKYVGQAKDLEVRQCDWKRLSQPYAGELINNARAKYGIDAFGFEILKECEDEEMNYWETYYIKKLNTKKPYGYNMTDGGEGRLGCPCSEQTKRKIGDANKGRKRSEEWCKMIRETNKGRKRSEQTKRKISEANKNKKLSEKTKNKISETMKGIKPWNTGKPLSEETKNKISESHKGKKLSEEHKKKISETRQRKTVFQIDKNTNVVIAEFPSTKEIQRQLGFNSANISMCCNGKKKTCGGFIWKYKESVA